MITVKPKYSLLPVKGAADSTGSFGAVGVGKEGAIWLAGVWRSQQVCFASLRGRWRSIRLAFAH